MSKNRIYSAVCCSIAMIFSFMCLIPFIVALSASFTDEVALAKYGFGLWPSRFSLEAYKMIFEGSQIYRSYAISMLVTTMGTFLSLSVTILVAYPLSTGRLLYGRTLNFYIYFTMLFSGGLVPSYMLISRYLGMKNSIWVLIIPVLLNPWNVFLMRNFFSSIPSSLAESAKIDGASEIGILAGIILPVSKPALATIGLFYALGYWNNWFQSVLYIDKNSLRPLQAIIMEMLRNAEFMSQMSGQMAAASVNVPTVTSKMSTAIVTIGPIVLVYPMVQKYFTSGLMVGAVKG